MKKNTSKLVLVALLIAQTFASTHAAAPADAVVARVGDREVLAGDVLPVLEAFDARQRAAISNDPAAMNQLVRNLILQQVLLQEALEEGYDKRPGVRANLERIRQNAIAEGFLETSTKVPDDYPSASEIQEVFEANKEQLLLPKRLQLAQIFIASPEGQEELESLRAKRKLDDVLAKLRAPKADFSQIAKEFSDDTQSAANGGEIGLLAEDALEPGVREAVAGLKAGEISKPVRLPGGWHIVKLVDIEDARPAKLEEVQDLLAGRMREQKALQNREAFLNQLLQENPVAINELALTDLLKSGLTPGAKSSGKSGN